MKETLTLNFYKPITLVMIMFGIALIAKGQVSTDTTQLYVLEQAELDSADLSGTYLLKNVGNQRFLSPQYSGTALGAALPFTGLEVTIEKVDSLYTIVWQDSLFLHYQPGWNAETSSYQIETDSTDSANYVNYARWGMVLNPATQKIAIQRTMKSNTHLHNQGENFYTDRGGTNDPYSLSDAYLWNFFKIIDTLDPVYGPIDGSIEKALGDPLTLDESNVSGDYVIEVVKDPLPTNPYMSSIGVPVQAEPTPNTVLTIEQDAGTGSYKIKRGDLEAVHEHGWNLAFAEAPAQNNYWFITVTGQDTVTIQRDRDSNYIKQEGSSYYTDSGLASLNAGSPTHFRLRAIETTPYSNLGDLYIIANKLYLNASNVRYASGAISSFYPSLSAAYTVFIDASATDQEQIDATAALQAAVDALDAAEIDDSNLSSVLDSAYVLLSDAQAAVEAAIEEYEIGAMAAFLDSINNAQAAYDNWDLTQAEVDNAQSVLEESISAFINSKVDLTALQAKIAEATTIISEASPDDYEEGAISTLQEAIASAQTEVDKTGHYQADVDAELVALQEAIDTFNASLLEAEASVSKSNLEFGDVEVGVSGLLSLIASNVGVAPLEITEIITPDGFSVDRTAPISLPKDESINMEVTFSPNEKKVYSGNVVFKTNVGDVVVNVSGTGVIPLSTDIEEAKAVFGPNPVKDILNLDINIKGECIVSVLSLDGKEYYHKVVQNSSRERVNLTSLPLGMYLLKIKTPDKEIVEKLIKR